MKLALHAENLAYYIYMLALCVMLFHTHYAQNYVNITGTAYITGVFSI